MKKYNVPFFGYLTILEIVIYVIIIPGSAFFVVKWLYDKGYITQLWNWLKSLFSKGTTSTTSTTGPKIIVSSDTSKPRGIRNKNPLNIMYNSANKWDGQTGSDGTFCVFSDMKYGCRAGLKLLVNYIKGGTNTINLILIKWAADGGSYTNFVAQDTGIMRDKVLSATDRESICRIAYSMHKFENGGTFLTYEDFNSAWDLI